MFDLVSVCVCNTSLWIVCFFCTSPFAIHFGRYGFYGQVCVVVLYCLFVLLCTLCVLYSFRVCVCATLLCGNDCLFSTTPFTIHFVRYCVHGQACVFVLYCLSVLHCLLCGLSCFRLCVQHFFVEQIVSFAARHSPFTSSVIVFYGQARAFVLYCIVALLCPLCVVSVCRVCVQHFCGESIFLWHTAIPHSLLRLGDNCFVRCYSLFVLRLPCLCACPCICCFCLSSFYIVFRLQHAILHSLRPLLVLGTNLCFVAIVWLYYYVYVYVYAPACSVMIDCFFLNNFETWPWLPYIIVRPLILFLNNWRWGPSYYCKTSFQLSKFATDLPCSCRTSLCLFVKVDYRSPYYCKTLILSVEIGRGVPVLLQILFLCF